MFLFKEFIPFSIFVYLMITSNVWAFGSGICDPDLREYQQYKKRHDEIRKKVDEAKKYLNSISISRNSAIIFDIDGTVIDAVKTETGFTFNTIPEVLDLYSFAQSKGLKRIFITARPTSTLPTIRSLLYLYQYRDFDHVIAIPDPLYKEAIKRPVHRAREFIGKWKKQARSFLVLDHKVDIVMTVEDQWENLEGEYVGYPLLIPSLTVTE